MTMAVAGQSYIQEREGVLFVGATRVTLSSLIGAWQTEGYTAEEARPAFPSLTLAQVYGAIAYYLEHQAALDAAFRDDAEQYQQRRAQDRQERADFYHQLEERRTRLSGSTVQPPRSAPDDHPQAGQ